MTAQFFDTNVLIYAHERGSGPKFDRSIQLIETAIQEGACALSTQVLAEFYAAAIRKLRMDAEEAETVLADLGTWTVHRPAPEDLLRAARLHRRHGIPWWDSLIVVSALELGCDVLWSEDFGHGRRFESLEARNPYL